MNGVGINLFWIPKEVRYYVIVPIVAILVIYLVFSLVYRRKKGTRYYDYVVDYVFSTLGIVFCALLFSLILGYSISTIRALMINRIIENYVPLATLLVILPIIPFGFLIFVIRVFFKNLKRKELLDAEEFDAIYESNNKIDELDDIDIDDEDLPRIGPVEKKEPDIESVVYEDVELIKKNG
ncbi:MAG: hypothetical protein IJ068_07825 [Bacilli bacterium]|nr:hypothetical protein [Bacilli bacterium]